ncbi:hypothetical protein [Gluconobacter albidus]|uniref:hypothetical protein n=1 Tax=Gluconobacter albidus TaxID=318683 RepID=UPI0022329C29|nr:hypothetical protein [Gluconobacter albidus]
MPNVPAHQTFWEKFFDTPVAVVAACSAVVTVFVSVGTLGVTIFNSFLTKKFTEANHDLAKQQADIAKSNHGIAKQQAEIALENKEISKRKYNLDVINKRWDLFGTYLSDYRISSSSIIGNFLHIHSEKFVEADNTMFANFFLNDSSKRIQSMENIDAFFTMAKSFTTPETTACIEKLSSDMLAFSRAYSSFNYKGFPSNVAFTKIKSLQSSVEYYIKNMDVSHDEFIKSFVQRELDGLSKID